MNENKETLSFFIYMWNTFSKNEACIIWGGDIDDPYSLANHIWNKWCDFTIDYGPDAAIAKLVASLDEDNLNMIIARACSLYCGRSNR